MKPTITNEERFLQAQTENWASEMDWLWLADRLTDPAQRRYCIERALTLNPMSFIAQGMWASLPPATDTSRQGNSDAPNDTDINPARV